jgi:uncharacterized iron-regulated membrane protein
MNLWQRWLTQPRTVFLRKALFQVHLWLGLITGLYIVMLSVTGSALVFLREMSRTFRTWDPWWMNTLMWTRDLHDELLFGRDGRWWNGVFSAVVTVLCLTGIVVWWPGIRNWRRGMAVKWKAAWPRFNFDLHSALGFWFFSMMLIWAVSGIYLGVPDPFTTLSEYIANDPEGITQTWFDTALLWMTRLHFGRWRSHTLKAIWVVMGLVPAALFITGAVMWWQRVVRRKNLLSDEGRLKPAATYEKARTFEGASARAREQLLDDAPARSQ